MRGKAAEADLEIYLRRLDRQLGALPPAVRAEIVEDTREHVLDAQRSQGDAELPAILRRLGEPAAIAADARARFDLPDLPPPGNREVIGLLLLAVGPWVVPLFAPLAALAVLGGSRCWEPARKRRALGAVKLGLLGLLVATVIGAVLLGGLAGGQGHSSSGGGAGTAPVNSGPGVFQVVLGGLFGAVLVVCAFLIPLGAAISLLRPTAGRRLRASTLAAMGVLALLVIAPVIAGVIGPSIQTARLSSDQSPQPQTPTASCHAFYGSRRLAWEIAQVNVGVCTDHGRTRVDWGPDCHGSGALLLATVTDCRVQSLPDGQGAEVHAQITYRTWASPLYTRSESFDYLIRADGSLQAQGG